MTVCRWVVTNGHFWAMQLYGRTPGRDDLHLLGAISSEASDEEGWDWWTADFKRKGHEPTRERAMRALEKVAAR